MAILSRCVAPDGDTSTEDLPVHWEGQSAAEATWEPKSSFVAAFPNFDLEGKISFGDTSNDTSGLLQGNTVGLSIATTKPKRVQ